MFIDVLMIRGVGFETFRRHIASRVPKFCIANTASYTIHLHSSDNTMYVTPVPLCTVCDPPYMCHYGLVSNARHSTPSTWATGESLRVLGDARELREPTTRSKTIESA